MPVRSAMTLGSPIWAMESLGIRQMMHGLAVQTNGDVWAVWFRPTDGRLRDAVGVHRAGSLVHKARRPFRAQTGVEDSLTQHEENGW